MEPQLLTLNAQLTTFIAGVQPPNLIGRIVAPPTPAQIIADVTFYYWRFDIDEYLRKVDSTITKVNRRGTIPVTDFAFTNATGVLADHGQQIIHPNDIRMLSADQPPQVLQVPVNTRMAKLKALAETFWFSHEYEVHDLLTTAANYSSAKTTNQRTAVAADMIDDPDVNPIKVIQGMVDTPLIPPNTLVIPIAVWRPFQRNKFIVSAIKAVLGDRAAVGGQVAEAEVAAFFGLKQVLVPKQRTNTAAPGQTGSYSRIWGKDLIAMNIEDAPNSTEAPYGGTALTAYGSIMSQGPIVTYTRNIQPGEENGGLYGALADIIGHTRKVILINPDSGFLLKNCVAADV
jgi:hypothetical protein